MQSAEGRISHVSDTALLTAACRARETATADGWVEDPYAERLAGARGAAIAESLPSFDMMCFGIGMRTRLLDVMIEKYIAQEHIASVLSVGAGLDTRPWRLGLPASLRWVESDLPPVLDYKSAVLASDQPRCDLYRLPADLNDAGERRAVFEAAIDPALMITEGLLMYLSVPTLRALAEDALKAVRFWALDVTSPALVRALHGVSSDDIEAVRATDHLEGEQILELVASCGWIPCERRTYVIDGTSLIPPARLRAIRQAQASAEKPPADAPADDPSGVHLYRRP